MQVLVVVVILLVTCVLLNVVYGQTQCPAAPVVAQDRRMDKTKLRIATYNAEWLFLTRKNCPGTGCPWNDLTQAEAHLKVVAKEITIINADILNLAEVQDCNVLHQLISYFDTDMGYIPYLLTGTDTATGQNVGILTRVDPAVNLSRTANRVTYPQEGTKCVASNSGSYGVSKHYFTYFNIQGLDKPLAIFGAHLLAFPDDLSRCNEREAQARVIANFVEAEAISKGYSVVVLGDMNDFDNKVLDASGNMPITGVLDILRDPVKLTDGDELVNAASFIKEKMNVYSYWYDRSADCSVQNDELSLIDHLLLSKDLTQYVDHGFVDHSYGPMCYSMESDHWPMVVQLDLTKKL